MLFLLCSSQRPAAVNLSPAIVHLPKGDAAGGTCSGVCVTGVTMPLADRRFASRLEIVGDQSGMLDALEPLRLRNLSSDGMLLESSHPLTVGSIHEFQLIDGSTSVRVRAAVRHMSLGRQSSADRVLPGGPGVPESPGPVVRGPRADTQPAVGQAGSRGGLRWSTSSRNVAAHRASLPKTGRSWPCRFRCLCECWISARMVCCWPARSRCASARQCGWSPGLPGGASRSDSASMSCPTDGTRGLGVTFSARVSRRSIRPPSKSSPRY